jgi:hypothetical protein
MDPKAMASTLIGIILVIAGLCVGIFAGFWWAFVGGIIQVVDAVKVTPVEAIDLALGIARIVFAGFIGTVTAMIAVFPGWAMLNR